MHASGPSCSRYFVYVYLGICFCFGRLLGLLRELELHIDARSGVLCVACIGLRFRR